MHRGFVVVALLAALSLSDARAAGPVRIGHFPNITHAQPLVGRTLGTYDTALGSTVTWREFNAGPSEMEALIAGQLDLAYVGPNPAVNAFLRSKGKALRIIAGASSGGASLVVPSSSPVAGAADFRGKMVASPELGNTQDVALRRWLRENGLTPGRDVQVTPVKNADILMLFQLGKLDGAWVPEPWVTRLLREGNGRILVDERTLWPGGRFPTAVLVARREFLDGNPDAVRRVLGAHVDTTAWILKNPAEARRRLNEKLGAIIGKPLPESVLEEAFTRVLTTYDPMAAELGTSARWAAELGYLPRGTDLAADLTGLVDTTLLNDVLKGRSLPQVR